MYVEIIPASYQQKDCKTKSGHTGNNIDRKGKLLQAKK
jgi:hypothetical protein